MKTFVITVAKNFLANHPKKGTPTNFEQKILSGEKTHTIRGNFAYWNGIVQQVKQGKALISVRQWSGRPYNSKQNEILKCYNAEIQPIHFRKWPKKSPYHEVHIAIGDTKAMFTGSLLDQVARKDGFEDTLDFIDWFPEEMHGCIIHLDGKPY